METKFTKGPWSIAVDEESNNVEIQAPNEWRSRIAGVSSWKGTGVAGFWAEEAAGNANLIAAAPELYEALEALLDDGGGNDDVRALGHAALAKARGETK